MSVSQSQPNALAHILLNDCFVLMEQQVVSGISEAFGLPLDFVKLYRQSPQWDKQVKRINDKRQLMIECLNRIGTLITLISKRL